MWVVIFYISNLISWPFFFKYFFIMFLKLFSKMYLPQFKINMEKIKFSILFY